MTTTVLAADRSARAWSFLTIEKRQNAANDGYDDRPDEYYSWDETVPRHRDVQVGDICVVRDSTSVLGVARVETLTTHPTTKVRRRCPRTTCSSTNLKARSTRRPTYRCSKCTAVFDEPATEVLDVTAYRAAYAGSWEPVDGALLVRQLEPAYRARATQHAIRELDVIRLRAVLEERGVRLGRWWVSFVRYDELRGGTVERVSRQRIGQGPFRRALLNRFGSNCAISGAQPLEALQAAHLAPFALNERHDAAAGLLLRADLHALFDAGLLWVDDEYRVNITPKLLEYPDYARFHRQPLGIPLELRPPSAHFARRRTLSSG